MNCQYNFVQTSVAAARGVKTGRLICLLFISLVLLLLPTRFSAGQPGAQALVSPGDSAVGSPSGSGSESGLINMEFRGADIRDVFRALARAGDTNVILDNSVQGQITLTLKDVTFEAALDLLTKTTGYEYRRIDNVYVVADPVRLNSNFDKKETRVFKLRYTDTTGLKDTLDILVPNAQYTLNEMNRTLIISGTPGQLDLVEEFLNVIDVPIPQIKTVARLEELSKDAMSDLGIDWSFSTLISKDSSGKLLNVGLGYEPTIKLLEEQGKATLLARPEISTLDGETGTILIGDRIPVVITEIVDGNEQETIEYIEAGVKLDVTSRYNGDGYLTIKIRPEISSITSWTPQGYPQIRTREVETTVRMRSGETIAIGGLFQTEEIKEMMKVPVLGDLPILGQLFRTESVDRRESEIVIFLTVEVVENLDVSRQTGITLNPYPGSR